MEPRDRQVVLYELTSVRHYTIVKYCSLLAHSKIPNLQVDYRSMLFPEAFNKCPILALPVWHVITRDASAVRLCRLDRGVTTALYPLP